MYVFFVENFDFEWENVEKEKKLSKIVENFEEFSNFQNPR